MRNSLRLTFWTLSLCAVILVQARAATTDTPVPTPKPAKEATMNSNATVIPPVAVPGVKVLSLAQGREAAAEAAAGQKALEAGDLGDADTEFRHSVRLNDADPDALAGLAQTFEREGKGPQAIAVYRYLLYPKKGWGTSMEQDPILRMHFALLLAGDGQWPEAVSVYESVINKVRIGPSYPGLDVHFSPETVEPALFQAMAHLAMGVTYNGRLEHEKALSEYAAAVKAQPNFALAYYCQGYGLQSLGRRTEAKADFAKAAELGEGDVKKAAQSPNGLLLR